MNSRSLHLFKLEREYRRSVIAWKSKRDSLVLIPLSIYINRLCQLTKDLFAS
jgi:hypothetical protein